MSIANEHPEEIPDTTPRFPEMDEDMARDMLKDFLAWLRAEKGYRICTKEGSTPDGKSLYDQVFRERWTEAVNEFMDAVQERPGPYTPPRPLVRAGEQITTIMADNDSEDNSEDDEPPKIDGLFEELPY